jgi:hypothetical protein
MVLFSKASNTVINQIIFLTIKEYRDEVQTWKQVGKKIEGQLLPAIF